jgi:NAD+ diphosphatase
VASWESGDIVLDETEIVDAGWYTADALPMVPPPLSIARRLIDDWLRRQA